MEIPEWGKDAPSARQVLGTPPRRGKKNCFKAIQGSRSKGQAGKAAEKGDKNFSQSRRATIQSVSIHCEVRSFGEMKEDFYCGKEQIQMLA